MLAVNPDDAYDVIALNAASASTMISGLPFEGPVSGVRLALIDGQWVAFPRWSERERAVFEIVVAGRVIENGDVAIAMIEAGAGKNAWHLIYDEGQTKPDEEVVAGGLEAAKPFIKVICEAQDELKKIAAKETKEFQLFPEYTDELYARIDEIAHKDLDEALSIAEKLPRQDRIHEIKEHVREVLANEFTDMDDARRTRSWATLQGAAAPDRAPPHPDRGLPHRRPWPARHPHPVRRGGHCASRARLRPVPAWRDPDSGRHHPEHAQDGAADRRAVRSAVQALHAQLRDAAVLHWRDRPRRLPEAS